MKPGLILAIPFALAAAAGCAQQPAAPPEPEGCARHQAAFPALIGGSEAAARAALAAMPGIRTIRSGGPDTPMTRDFRPDRASILVENGVVTRISCG